MIVFKQWCRPIARWDASQQTFLLFISANVVNLGNLVFNVLFGRWLGPELFGDLALLLTIKLGLMSIFVALQIKITDYTAKLKPEESLQFQSWMRDQIRSAIIIAAALTLPLIWLFYSASDKLPFSSPHLLPALALCFPVMVPLCLKRGIAQGEMALKNIILSAQAEMGVRLFGSALAWHLGFGLEGVAIVIAASIIAGYFFAGRTAPAPKVSRTQSHWKPIGLGLAPWAALQLSQVLHLDGEAIAAKINMSAQMAGEIAALDLIQRIFFFGCFALSAALIPLVAQAMRQDHPIWPVIRPVFLLVCGCAIMFLAALLIMPKIIVIVMFGEAFSPIAPIAWKAGLTAVIFTLTYLTATLGMTLGNHKIGYALLGLAILQCGVFAGLSMQIGANAALLFDAKIICQLGFFLYCLWAVFNQGRRLNARAAY